jgi:hypothetical protein
MSITNNLSVTDTVHGHKYSSPSIFYYIFHIKPHFFKKHILKLSLGRSLWNLFQDTQNSLNFICLSDSNFVCMVFVFQWFKHKWFFSDFIFVKIYSKFDVRKKMSVNHKKIKGTYKVRNEIETKRNQRKRNETKRNETKSTKTKRNETKSTKWKRNKTKPTKSTKTKRNTMLDYFPHMSQCLSPGEDRIWSPLNKNTMHLFSGSLSFSLSGFF